METKTEVDFKPIFRKDDCHAYKIFSATHCIQVCHGLTFSGDNHISICHAGIAHHSTDTKDCSEAEFIGLYSKVRAELDQLAEISLPV